MRIHHAEDDIINSVAAAVVAVAAAAADSDVSDDDDYDDDDGCIMLAVEKSCFIKIHSVFILLTYVFQTNIVPWCNTFLKNCRFLFVNQCLV